MQRSNVINILAAAMLLLMPETAKADWLKKATEVMGQVGATNGPVASSSLSNSEIIAGLKDALRVASENVVSQLGRSDGFNADPKVHIPLPEKLQRVKSALGAIGMSRMMDDLELRLNRAAEMATPKARRLFGNAIRAMSVDDARKILNGPDDAATQYFKGKMSSPLSDEMRPIVRQALAEAGAVQSYDAVMGEYQALPFVPDVKANLTQHVLELGLTGIFHYMATEEAAIRKEPLKRTTAILRKVFAGQ